ncbi:liprin-beta-1 isoform X1 [Oryzias latipes]|uniref:liprin-beta-1 isoform X1 n=1 Tax=Oryzias latipes TaxID=8090 RepID=UPI0009DB3C0D|nr:liprin-beta-1 isoform X1 [Oryzias latipes]XP_020569891.1 liprin-beta-1 isoform X1 [Oryzias latipes]
MMSDASEMLAAALEQMDGIIAGSKAIDYSNGLFDCQSPTSPFLGGLRVLHLLEDLRAALELMDNEEKDNLRCQISDSTAEGLAEWLQGRTVKESIMAVKSNVHSSDAVYQERLSRLESDKECLILQVSVLTDQVEVQGEKIRDLDNSLDQHREKLDAAEQLLQQELLNRTTLETQKLELMTEVSSLKLKLTSLERDHRGSEGLYQEVTDLRFRLTDVENERLQSERKLKNTSEELQLLQKRLEEQEEELRRLEGEAGVTSEGGERDAEMLRVRRALQALTSDNDEKERRIQELEESLAKCKNAQEPLNEKQRDHDYEDIQDDSSVSVSMEVNQVSVEQEEAGRISAESTPCIAVLSEMKELDRERRMKAAQSSADGKKALSEETGAKAGPGSPPSAKAHTADSFGSRRARASFGRGFFKLRGGKQAASDPNLAGHKGTEHLDLAGVPPQGSRDAPPPSPPENKKKSRGFRRFFGRLRRSHSTSFNSDEGDGGLFRRGGVRATAGPRLGWSREPKHNSAEAPFSRWSKEEVCAWLQEQGLGLYVAQGQNWIKSGQTLLQASQHELEKDLGVKQPLHRKKLQLALQALVSGEEDLKGKLDHNWVTRWLDDIGLPQYKSGFEEARVDGRMLHFMTVEDLLSLKVGSVLHHLSIKRAIQVLRLNLYDPGCLRRRPSDESNVTPAEISQWTNHRVMEWLRSVDLAEYAPNLRGSGVHGGLMVLEPRFNVEALALLLNIPPGKTLLRRHLATHFHLLVGAEAQRLKQECLENPDYQVLTATAKVKPRRLSFGGFGTLRKKRHDDGEEYVCPMNVEMPKSSSFQRSIRIYEDDLQQLEQQMEDSEGTVRQIGAFSEGINNLTIMLKDEEFLQEIPVCPPEGDKPGAQDPET